MIAEEEFASAGTRLERAAGRVAFGTDVEGYERGRIGYPPELYEIVLGPLEGRSATIVEIGPGTGIATVDLLAANPARLFAVEPDPSLATHLRERFAASAVQVMEMDFASAPIVGPVDLVVSAASFHWLDPDIALAHIRELLGPNGIVALWWNVYRQGGVGDLLADAIIPLLDGIPLPPSEAKGGHYSLDVALHRAQFERAGFELVLNHLFRRERSLSGAEVRALYASYSFVRALPAARRASLLDAISTLVDDRFGGVAPNVVLTPLYVARPAR